MGRLRGMCLPHRRPAGEGGSNLLPLLCALYLILYLDRVNIATAAPLIQG